MNDLIYTGWKKWTPTPEEWLEFYTSGKVPFEMMENEYLIIKTDDKKGFMLEKCK